MPRFAAFLFLAAMALSACNSRVEDDRPGQPVKHRQEAFKALLRASEPVGIMLSGEEFSVEHLGKLGEVLARTREAPWAYFGPDTNYPPSKSRPEVWTQAEKFEAERLRFFAATDALMAAGSRETAQAAYDEVRASCKSCHDAFRR